MEIVCDLSAERSESFRAFIHPRPDLLDMDGERRRITHPPEVVEVGRDPIIDWTGPHSGCTWLDESRSNEYEKSARARRQLL